MKIAFCHHLSLSYYGGGEKWLINLSNELVKRGHEVEIFALPFLLDGVSKVNPKEFLHDVSYTEGVRQKVKADVTYVTYNPLSWLNFKTSHPRIAGVHSHAYWFSPHPNYGLLPNIANIVNRFTSYFELRGFDAIHTLSDVFPVNHPNVYCIPNFVDSNTFKPVIPKAEDFMIAYASRQVWQKGWDVFNKLISNITADMALGNVRFLISGNIPEKRMPSFFSRAHATIVPSRVDTFGLTIVESLMCGTPVITSPLETHKSLGLPLLYSDSIDEYLESINILSRLSADEYFKVSDLCRRLAMKYDKENIVDRIESMLTEVANSGN